MHINNGHDGDAELEKRIEELKGQANDLAGGKMISSGLSDCPAELTEAFLKHVVEYEKAPLTTNMKQLEEAGIKLPPPDSMDDEQLSLKLWEVIDALAARRVFLESTNHLSDRELYTALWTDALREETPAIELDQDSACHLDMVGSGSEEDTDVYLKYYADEATRQDWRRDFPDVPVPEHEDPPYDRDQYLPAPSYSPPSEFDPEDGLEEG